MEICLQPLIEDLLQSLESETSSSVLNFGHSDTIQVRKTLGQDSGEKKNSDTIQVREKKLRHNLGERVAVKEL